MNPIVKNRLIIVKKNLEKITIGQVEENIFIRLKAVYEEISEILEAKG